jgi:hypothetical protein
MPVAGCGCEVQGHGRERAGQMGSGPVLQIGFAIPQLGLGYGSGKQVRRG